MPTEFVMPGQNRASAALERSACTVVRQAERRLHGRCWRSRPGSLREARTSTGSRTWCGRWRAGRRASTWPTALLGHAPGASDSPGAYTNQVTPALRAPRERAVPREPLRASSRCPGRPPTTPPPSPTRPGWPWPWSVSPWSRPRTGPSVLPGGRRHRRRQHRRRHAVSTDARRCRVGSPARDFHGQGRRGLDRRWDEPGAQGSLGAEAPAVVFVGCGKAEATGSVGDDARRRRCGTCVRPGALSGRPARSPGLRCWSWPRHRSPKGSGLSRRRRAQAVAEGAVLGRIPVRVAQERRRGGRDRTIRGGGRRNRHVQAGRGSPSWHRRGRRGVPGPGPRERAPQLDDPHAFRRGCRRARCGGATLGVTVAGCGTSSASPTNVSAGSSGWPGGRPSPPGW